MVEEQIFVKFAREELSLFQHFKVVLSVPVSEKKMSQPNNGPNMKQTNFSNSLIIHEEKTKEITTVKEVWICDPNYHKIRRSFALIFSKSYQCFEKLYQTRRRVFHQISKHFKVG